jgi:hypothetical protein
MMCIACEQNFMWLAYLESRGLTGPDGRTAMPGSFAAPDKPLSTAIEQEAADQKKFSCDDPTAG